MIIVDHEIIAGEIRIVVFSPVLLAVRKKILQISFAYAFYQVRRLPLRTIVGCTLCVVRGGLWVVGKSEMPDRSPA
jgi:hypothetical protein